jgi:Right handed beta helix region
MGSRFSPRLARMGAIAAAAALAASLLIAPVAGAEPSSLYVSASHGNDSWPCTAGRPCATIGHAVAVAPDGATIYVLKGVYDEQVSIGSRLNLKGQGAVIDATGQTGGIEPLASFGIVGYGLALVGPGAAGSSVEGFTVRNAIGEGILAALTSDVLIAHNVVRGNDAGFGTSATLECTEQGNVPGDCGEGLHLLSVTHATVVHNLVEDNVGGILVTDEAGPSAHNTISYNVSRDNRLDCGITLPSHNAGAVDLSTGQPVPAAGGVYDNLVSHNISENNGGAGVGMFAPFPGTASYGNRIIDNKLVANGEEGVGIHAHAPLQYVSRNVISGNFISGNGVDPDANSVYPVGISLFSAVVPVDVTVTGNHISNEYWGIFTNGAFTIGGLFTNRYTRSVAHHTS